MKRDEIFIERIAAEIKFIRNHVDGKNKQGFLSNELLQHAIMMSIITIGECANQLSEAFKSQHNQIEWRQIVAVRNIAAHGYWQLDMEQVWQALEEDIPLLDNFIDSL